MDFILVTVSDLLIHNLVVVRCTGLLLAPDSSQHRSDQLRGAIVDRYSQNIVIPFECRTPLKIPTIPCSVPKNKMGPLTRCRPAFPGGERLARNQENDGACCSQRDDDKEEVHRFGWDPLYILRDRQQIVPSVMLDLPATI